MDSEHEHELNRYLGYFKSKKDGCVKEVEQVLDDFRQDNVTDSIFNREDVELMMDKLKEEMKKVIDEEVSTLVRVSGIYVQTVLSEAQKSDAHIKVDLNLIENNTAIENIKKIESKTAKDFAMGASGMKMSKNMGAKLPSLPSGGALPDTSANSNKNHELEEEINNLKKRNQQLQADLVKLSKDKEGTPSFNLRSEGEYAEEIHDLKTKMKEYEEMIKEFKDEINKKMNESTQFNSLKKMMQTRNEQIKSLRDRLSKYETVE